LKRSHITFASYFESDELIHLRTNKLQPGERRTVGDLGIPSEKVHHSLVDVVKIGDSPTDSKADKESQNNIEMNEISSNTDDKKIVNDSKSVAAVESVEAAVSTADDNKGGDPVEGKSEAPNEQRGEDESVEDFPDTTNGVEKESEASGSGKASGIDQKAKKGLPKAEEQSDETPALNEKAATEEEKESGDSETEKGTEAEDDDSDAAVGKEDAAKLDQDLMVEESDEKDESPEVTNGKVTVMFQKLLSLGGNSGQVTVKVSDEDAAGKLWHIRTAAYYLIKC
jgi:hypothetical protein